jgi:hypothetical protein
MLAPGLGCIHAHFEMQAVEIRSPKPEIRNLKQFRIPNVGGRRSAPAWPRRRVFGLSRNDAVELRVERATGPFCRATSPTAVRSTRRQVAAENGQVGRSTQTYCMVTWDFELASAFGLSLKASAICFRA